MRVDVRQQDMNHLSLFTGVAGVDLAAEWAGIRSVAFCEREPFPQKVLRKHWPDVPIYDDVCTLTKEVLQRDGILSRTRTIDIISAGFPCQPFSAAGKRGGTDDERYLWPEVVRILQEVQPTWFVGENVAGILSMAEPDGAAQVESRTVQSGEEEDFYEAVFTQQEIMLFGNICKDLEDIGYEVQPFVVPAAAVGAKHLRERVFIVAYANSRKREERMQRGVRANKEETDARVDDRLARFGENSESLANPDSFRDNGQGECRTYGNWQEIMQKRELSQHGFSNDSQNVANTNSEPSGGLSFGKGTQDTGSSFSCEDVADTSSFGRQGQRKLIQPIDSKTCGERKTSESLNVCFGTERTTQSLLGGSPNELSSWMDGSGVNPLDAFGEYIANYPQPAPLGMDQYNWEPPRVATGVRERTGRLKALGNAVDPLQIYPVMAAIKAINDSINRA
ncbi:DNA cytosine methyltransferase [Paenibacillus sp. NPDC058367]|uniref:DNA cytosine methyltransferase n=1 Tax=Paenibacillus sp. NPDC058367 TaxID=3346460 RepID=UPI00366A42E0